MDALYEIQNYGFRAQKVRLVPQTVDLFGKESIELRAREREELPEKDKIVAAVLRDPIVQEVIKIFTARIADVRLKETHIGVKS